MSPDEKRDSDILREKIETIKLDRFDAMAAIMRMPKEQLVHTGHKSVESALLWFMEKANSEIKKLTDAFFKKYPD